MINWWHMAGAACIGLAASFVMEGRSTWKRLTVVVLWVTAANFYGAA